MNGPLNTVSILTEYAFPKLSQYYSSKGKTCILEQYQNQINQYFINNQLNLQSFYTSSITKSDFIANTIKFIDDQNRTQNDGNYALQTAIKRLYTILQLHQHTASAEPTSPNTCTNTTATISIASPRDPQLSIKKRERERDSGRINMVRQLSTAQSELLALQQKVQTLQQIANETQQNFLETKEKEEEYKHTVNELEQKLTSEKTQISQTNNANKQLQNELQQILSVNRQLNDKMVQLEESKQTVAKYKQIMNALNAMNSQLKNELIGNKQQINELEQSQQTVEKYKQTMDALNTMNSRLKLELNENKQQMNKLEESDKKQHEYKQTINDLKNELNENKQQINELEESQQTVEQYKQTLDALNTTNSQLKLELNDNKQQINKLEETDKKQHEYEQTINDLKNELKSKQWEPQIAPWRQQLQTGSKLDCLDEECVWYTTTVIDSDGYRIKVRLMFDMEDVRWDDTSFGKGDEWLDRGSTRIAPYMSQAKTATSVALKIVAKKKDKQTGKILKVYKQGWLVKQGKRFKSYKPRYFRLTDDGTMAYFKQMTDKSTTGSFNIKNMIETRRIKYPKNKSLYGFEIVTKDRTWRLQAHSDQLVSEWINVIHAVSKGVANINAVHSPSTCTVSSSFDNDEKENNLLQDLMDNVNRHSGWMYKAGKWDANWTHRYCVLSIEPSVTLRCYVAPNKKQTHCIEFADVKSCFELETESEKFSELEIPTAFAFHLITSSRIYTFACKSKHDINVWLKKIHNVVDVSSNTNPKLVRRSSIVKLGSSLNKLGNSFGRLIGVTPEHVTTTQVLETEHVQIEKNVDESESVNISFGRRASVPAIAWDKSRKKNLGRRLSAPCLDGLSLIVDEGDMKGNGSGKEIIMNADEHNVAFNSNWTTLDDVFVNESLSDLDEY